MRLGLYITTKLKPVPLLVLVLYTMSHISGSELVQKFIGEGSRMVRELFVMAREHAPSIIFMDEIDSIGSTRIESGSGGDSEVQRTMLELLNQLDGFEATKNIKVIMATNRIDILDSALLRPGKTIWFIIQMKYYVNQFLQIPWGSI